MEHRERGSNRQPLFKGDSVPSRVPCLPGTGSLIAPADRLEAAQPAAQAVHTVPCRCGRSPQGGGHCVSAVGVRLTRCIRDCRSHAHGHVHTQPGYVCQDGNAHISLFSRPPSISFCGTYSLPIPGVGCDSRPWVGRPLPRAFPAWPRALRCGVDGEADRETTPEWSTWLLPLGNSPTTQNQISFF